MATAVFTSFDQQLDNEGVPLDGGSVTVYQAGTTTSIQLYNDDDLAGGHETANPITLDSSGRHAITYFSTQSYKVLVKNSGGSTIYTRDNIDPGVPVGTGALPIANGGTGATVAATALSNLGGATAAELADVAADVAALAGAAASVEKTHIATGTTAQRPASPIEGDIRRNTSTSVWEFYSGSVYQNVVLMPTGQTDPSATDSAEGLVELAVQSEMETGTDTVRAVVPGRQHFHQSASKCWLKTDTAGNINASYNITSITDTAAGIVDVTIATDFSSAHYAIANAPGVGGNSINAIGTAGNAPTAGTFRMNGINCVTAADADLTSYYAAAFGDQA